MGTLYLVIGPVGAGKSTFARRKVVAGGGVFLDLDTWMVRLFGSDARPKEHVISWYLERRDRCRELMWDVTLEVLVTGADVFLELGLVSVGERDDFYRRARDEGARLVVYHLDAPREVRRARVAQRNRSTGTHVQRVPMPFFERASDAWEAPTEAERSAVEVLDV